MKPGEIGEFGLIERLAAIFRREARGLIRGIGDDAAVIDWPADRLLLATADTLIDGVHFCGRRRFPDLPEAGFRGIGRRAATVNLSDIAAMGGRPRFALISLSVPDEAEVGDIEDLCIGIAEAFEESGAMVAGGNTARAPERLALDISLLGAVDPSALLTRDGARPGDILCVTGDLGAAAAGLHVLEIVVPGSELTGAFLEVARRHLAPVPRLAAGTALGALGAATSCIDISDGLLADAGHLARASGVSVRIDGEAIPLAEATREAARTAGLDPLTLALTGGEDYELLCTVRPECLDGAILAVRDIAGVALTPIGEVKSGPPEALAVRSGRPWSPLVTGFEHFAPSGTREGR